MAQIQPLANALRGDVGTELLVDQDSGLVGGRALTESVREAVEDHGLGVDDLGGLGRRGIAVDPEHLLLERAPVVEGEDEERLVVSEGHRGVLLISGRVRQR